MAFETYKKSLIKILDGKNDKRLILYGADKFTFFIKAVLEGMGMHVAYIVWHEKTPFEEILDSLELMYEDKNEVFVLVAISERHGEVNDLLINSYRLTEEIHYAFISGVGYVPTSEYLDIHLGYSCKFDMVGFSTYGNPETAKKSIVVLGGSTSMHEMGGVDCWPLKLHQLLNACDNNTAIYNGAIVSYSSAQDCIKLLRDGLSLKSDIVIAFGGFNDANPANKIRISPFATPYQRDIFEFLISNGSPRIPYVSQTNRKISYGLESDMSLYDQWIYNNRCMYALCKEFGVEFRAILQPCLFYGDYEPNEEEAFILDLLESRLGGSAKRKKDFNDFYSNAIHEMTKYPFFRDFTGIFSDSNGNYYDLAHTTEKGNQIIAERVYDMLMKEGLI